MWSVVLDSFQDVLLVSNYVPWCYLLGGFVGMIGAKKSVNDGECLFGNFDLVAVILVYYYVFFFPVWIVLSGFV